MPKLAIGGLKPALIADRIGGALAVAAGAVTCVCAERGACACALLRSVPEGAGCELLLEIGAEVGAGVQFARSGPVARQLADSSARVGFNAWAAV